jgi:hypothetical protein
MSDMALGGIGRAGMVEFILVSPTICGESRRKIETLRAG